MGLLPFKRAMQHSIF